MSEARQIFENASKSPEWLGQDHLELLHEKYPVRPKTYLYDSSSLEERGAYRAREILKLVRVKCGKTKTYENFLELGCGDGMTSSFIQRSGKKATAVDTRSEVFDKRAIRTGVTFKEMDVHQLDFESEKMDFVFSYNAFEHFEKPESVLEEMIRVTKRGGYIYLSFGPLFMAPKGLHAYSSLAIPYCQHLFQKKMIIDFVKTKNLRSIEHIYVNGYSLEDYRKIWDQYSRNLKIVTYYEKYCDDNLKLMMEYPTCFKSKTNYFDNLVVTAIEVLFERVE